jgi:adenylate kinase
VTIFRIVILELPPGQGVFQGTPLSLSGVMRIMKAMEWGEAGDFISLGNLGANEVPSADVFILIAPQNISGASVLPLIEQMAAAAEREGKTIITVNSRLTDVPSSAGVMGVRGRQERLDFVATFEPAFHFRLLFLGASMYPVMGALKYSYGGPWEVYKRVDIVSESGQKYEEYQLIGEFEKEPNSSRITACFQAARKANR